MDTTQPMNLAVGGNSPGDHSLYRGGFTIGQFMRDNANGISNAIMALLVIATVWLIVALIQNTAASIEAVEANASMLGATSAYMSAMYHQRCKNHGGCSKSCPFISEDDPRVIIYKQLEAIDMMNGQVKQGVKDDRLLIDMELSKISDETKRTTTATTWNGIVEVQQRASTAIGKILDQLKDLDRAFGEVETIDVALVDAKNKATALGAAAVIHKNVLVVASLHLNAQIMMQCILTASPDRQQKIVDYDRLVTVAAMAANTGDKSIANIYKTTVGLPDSINAASAAVAPSATSNSQDIVKAMAALMASAQTSDETVGTVVAKLSDVAETYRACKHAIDRFSNNLPGSMSNDKMTELIQEGDYETAIIRTALEPDIVSNHKKFAKERSSFESGGGIQSVRDDDNDVVPWVGLFGRPTYRKSNGDSVDVNTGASNDVLKSIPSDVPTALMRKSTLRLGTTTFKP